MEWPKGFTALEVGWRERKMYNPIRADGWSCGKVLLTFLEANRTKDGNLGRFAEQLMDENLLHRPSLADWSERRYGSEREQGMKVQVKDDGRGDGGLENCIKREM